MLAVMILSHEVEEDAAINNAKGTYVAYSTAPGTVAQDGKGDYSPFTQHLIKNIQKPYTLNQLFISIRIGVNRDTEGKQLPWSSSSVMGEFYFTLPDKNSIVDPIPTPVTIKKGKPGKVEQEIWDIVLKSKKIKDYEEYLSMFPQGYYVQEAQASISKLKEDQEKKRKVFIKAEWEKIKKSRYEEDFTTFIETYPKSDYAKLATFKKRVYKGKYRTYPLTINTTPKEAKVQITNITQKYCDGIELKKGEYSLKIEKEGYETKEITLSQRYHNKAYYA